MPVEFDYSEFLALCRRRAISIAELANVLGLSYSTMSKKLHAGHVGNSKCRLWCWEAYALAEYVGIPPIRIGEFFFKVKVE